MTPNMMHADFEDFEMYYKVGVPKNAGEGFSSNRA